MPLTADNTALVLDSTADLADPAAEHPNWRMVPLVVRFGEEAFRDHVDITPAEFYARLREARELPRTAAPAPGAWEAVFAELDGYRHVLVLPIARTLSASGESARLAAEAADPDGTRIAVLDPGTVSVGTLLVADGVQRLLERGAERDEVLAFVDRARSRLRLLFSVDTLEYLERGGRIGRAQALVGSMLKVRPILTLEGGEVTPLGRVRGRSRVLAEFARVLSETVPEGGGGRAGVAHADDPAVAAELRELIGQVRPGVAVDREATIGPVLGTYGGPGAFGILVLPDG